MAVAPRPPKDWDDRPTDDGPSLPPRHPTLPQWAAALHACTRRVLRELWPSEGASDMRVAWIDTPSSPPELFE